MAKTTRQVDDTPPPRRNRIGAVGNDTNLIGRQAFARAGFTDSTLILRWAEIVGPDVARIARPLKLVEKGGSGVLTLKAEAAASVFLEHDARSLCARINAFLGREAVTRLRFVHGTLAPVSAPSSNSRAGGDPAPPEDPAHQFDGPEGLKSALLELARLRQAANGRHG